MFGERELLVRIELSVTWFAVKIADSLTFIILICLCKTNNLLGAKFTAGINCLIYQPTFTTPFLLWSLVLNPISASPVKAFPGLSAGGTERKSFFLLLLILLRGLAWIFQAKDLIAMSNLGCL